MSQIKFLRIKNSQSVQWKLHPKELTKAVVHNRQFLYFDFTDENHVRLLQREEPEDSEEETELIGGDHIAGINKLSQNTYKMFQYLSENRVLNDQKRNIDQVVRDRIEKIQSRRKKKKEEESGGGKQRKNLKNYSVLTKGESGSGDLGMDSDKLEEYLEKYNSNKLIDKLKAGERHLQKSISSAGHYKKSICQMEHNKKSNGPSLDLKINNLLLKLPNINKIRYDKSRA